tara:strand:- start:182 stop:385 length:204 start_codon:yes stop_codon:yes gene_type:complete
MIGHGIDEKQNKKEEGTEAALALIQALVIGDDIAKKAAYQRLQHVWTQTEIDDLTVDVEALFRAYAG